MAKLNYDLEWQGPVAWKDRLTLPNDRGHHVYAIIQSKGDSYALLRIGAALKVKSRISQYRILKYVPDLWILWNRASDEYIAEFRSFLIKVYNQGC
jgi:hypothetical protein